MKKTTSREKVRAGQPELTSTKRALIALGGIATLTSLLAGCTSSATSDAYIESVGAQVQAAYACADVVQSLEYQSMSYMQSAYEKATEAADRDSTYRALASRIGSLLNSYSEDQVASDLRSIASMCDSIME